MVAACAFAAGLLWVAAYFDPDRPLREAEARLADGKPVTLIGATGPPLWLHWSMGGDATTLTRGQNEPFALATLAMGQLKLLPDPQTKRYRFRVEVRHDQAMESLLHESEKIMALLPSTDLRDAGIIASAQKLEH